MNQSAQNKRLFSAVADGRATAEEFEQLELLLENDKAMRQEFIRFMASESDLYELANEIVPPQPQSQISPVTFFLSIATNWMMGGSMLLLAALGLLAWSVFGQAGTKEDRQAKFVSSELYGQKEIAVVRFTDDLFRENAPAWLSPGTPLKPGSLEFDSGTIEIEFYKGAVVTLEGPAEFHLLSRNEASLLEGKAAALVGPSGKGFVINSRDIGVVDLGTEFAMTINSEDSTSRVHVYDGEVEVSLMTDAGDTPQMLLVSESESVLVRRGSNQIEPDDEPFPMARVRSEHQAQFVVNENYVQAVKDSEPLIYWRFEETQLGAAENQRVLNEMSGTLHGDFVNLGDPNAMTLKDGAVRFELADKPRYITTEEPITGTEWDEYSIEFWVKANSFNQGAMVGIVDFEFQRKHLSLVEIAPTSYLHPEGAMRFLDRRPPGVIGGQNLFTPIPIFPDRWHYVCAVKSSAGLELQIDGRKWVLTDTGANSEVNDPIQDMKVLIGALDSECTERQFSGQLDEVAIYDRALKQHEIDQHYRSIQR